MIRKCLLAALPLLAFAIPTTSRAADSGPVLCEIIMGFSALLGDAAATQAEEEEGPKCPKDGPEEPGQPTPGAPPRPRNPNELEPGPTWVIE